MKDVPGTARLEAQKPGGMCQYKVKLTAPGEVDGELVGVDAAGLRRGWLTAPVQPLARRRALIDAP